MGNTDYGDSRLADRSAVLAGGSFSRRDFLKTGGAGLAGVALLGVAGCGGGSSQGNNGGGGQEYSFRLAETHPQDYPTTRADQRFADLASERSNGRISIEVFPSSQLGEEASVIEQVQTGAIAMTRVSSSPLAEFAPNMGVFSLPYIFDSEEHMWNFLQNEDGQALLDELEDSGFKGLAWYGAGARSFYTAERQVTSVEDMQGLQTRVQQSDLNVQFMQALGAEATPMDFGAVYSALQNGVVDGAENNWSSYLSTSHYEVAPNFTEDQHTRVPEPIIMSQESWEQLSEEDQQIVQQAAKDSVSYQREQFAQAEEDAEAEVREAGVNVVEADELDLNEWREAVQPLIDKNRDQYGEILDQIEAAKP